MFGSVVFKSGCDEFNFLHYRFDFQNGSWFVRRLCRFVGAADNNVAVVIVVGLIARLKIFDLGDRAELERLIRLVMMTGLLRTVMRSMMRVAGRAHIDVRL